MNDKAEGHQERRQEEESQINKREEKGKARKEKAQI